MTRTLILPPVRPEKASLEIQWGELRRWARQYSEVWLALGALLLILFSVMFADHLTIYDPNAGMNLSNRMIPPFWVDGGSITHPFGTDNLGRDVLSRTLHGGWMSLQVALIASSIATAIGMGLGIIAGYAGGTIDRVIVGITDVWISFPFLVLALAVIAAVGSSPTILVTLLILAGWVHAARVTRAQVMQIKHYDYVLAANAFGATPLHTIRYHILPGVLNMNVVMWTFSVGTLVLIEGSLSFIGLGMSPTTPSWGNMLSDGRMYLQDAWWMSIFPGLALVLTILSVNALGDALQKLNAGNF